MYHMHGSFHFEKLIFFLDTQFVFVGGCYLEPLVRILFDVC